MRLTKSAADYAAIAVAPILIFIMISSLASFLDLFLYHGQYPGRVTWTLLMFTMGSVAIARLAIEQDRAYSLGYAFVLGLVAFGAMLRFVDSPIFCAFILIVIGYLADVIVRDCTLIEDDVDASGQGLIDSGRLFVEQQMRSPDADSTSDEESSGAPKQIINAQQPGRTILYFALGALPMFGIGQFMMRDDPASWTSAKRFLAFYLFSSLSLLVTTSFLGLRRYLRQRSVEMPNDVTVSWLAGGVAMIAAVLFVAYAAPTPGRTIASIDLSFLDSPDGLTASRWGWGDEGAEKSTSDAAQTSSDPNADGKQTQGMRSEKGAPAGAVSGGDRKDGPTGQQQGGSQQSQGSGDQQSGKQQGEQSAKSNSQSNSQDSSRQQSQSPSQQQSDNSQKQQQSPSQQQSQNQQKRSQNQQQQSPNQQPSQDREQASQQANDPSDTNESEASESESQSESPSSDDQPKSDDEGDGQSQEDTESDGERDAEQSNSESSTQPSGRQRQQQSTSSNASSPPSGTPSGGIGSLFSMIGGILKLIIVLVLAVVVARFLYLNREAIAAWWRRLFERDLIEDDIQLEQIVTSPGAPPRPFSSFSNPVGTESDPRKVLVITFQAFEAWSREQGVPRDKDETPAEFVKRAAKSAPVETTSASQVVDAYNRIVYGRGRASKRDVAAATQVWQFMSS